MTGRGADMRGFTDPRGFTLIEVLVALLIIAGGVIALSMSWSGSFMQIRKAALNNNVAVLLERKMVETEAKYKTKYSEIPESDGGEFEDAGPQYSWELKSRELKLPDLTPMILGQDEHPDETMVAMLKQMTEQLSKAIKEVQVTVIVKRAGKELKFSATQYFVNYGQSLDLGGGGGAK